jgi:hypothetical protein
MVLPLRRRAPPERSTHRTNRPQPTLRLRLRRPWPAYRKTSARQRRQTLQPYPLPVGRVKNDSGNQPESAPQPVYLHRPEQLRTTGAYR